MEIKYFFGSFIVILSSWLLIQGGYWIANTNVKNHWNNFEDDTGSIKNKRTYLRILIGQVGVLIFIALCGFPFVILPGAFFLEESFQGEPYTFLLTSFIVFISSGIFGALKAIKNRKEILSLSLEKLSKEPLEHEEEIKRIKNDIKVISQLHLG